MSDIEKYIEAYKKRINHPFFNAGAIERLIKEYKTHGKLVVGFDFDNTVFDVHNNGCNYSDIINLLRECKKLGFLLCLYTSEPDEDWLEWKIQYCGHFGIEPDYINDSPLLPGTKKPFFNILLDDRAGLESAYIILKTVVDYANSKSDQHREE